MKRRFIVFDLGETLIDFHKANGIWYSDLQDIIIPSWFQIIRDSGYLENVELSNFREVVYPIIHNKIEEKKKIPMIDRIKDFLQQFKLPITQLLIENLLEAFFITIKDSPTIYNDVLKVLKYLQINGFKLGLYSNTPWQSPGYLMDRILDRVGIKEFFDVRLYSGDHGNHKPDPAVFQMVVDQAHEKKENMVYIGDSYKDILCAERFGIPSIWINRLNAYFVDNGPKPTFTISQLNELLEILEKL
jgi:FMN phosphatase YigB (HAD superfamily)